MSKLSFIPQEGHCITADEPGTILIPGQARNYVGYTFNPKTHSYDLSGLPFEVQAETPLGRRLKKLAIRDRSLIAFDEATSRVLGTEFKPYVFKNGDWIESKSIKKPSETPTSSTSKKTQKGSEGSSVQQ